MDRLRLTDYEQTEINEQIMNRDRYLMDWDNEKSHRDHGQTEIDI